MFVAITILLDLSYYAWPSLCFDCPNARDDTILHTTSTIPST